jgi:hypothetical protein
MTTAFYRSPEVAHVGPGEGLGTVYENAEEEEGTEVTEDALCQTAGKMAARALKLPRTGQLGERRAGRGRGLGGPGQRSLPAERLEQSFHMLRGPARPRADVAPFGPSRAVAAWRKPAPRPFDLRRQPRPCARVLAPSRAAALTPRPLPHPQSWSTSCPAPS